MRKAISFVLVLALVLGSFSMAFAADTSSVSLSDIAGNANEDAIQVAYDLGIVTGNPDGTFLPDKSVNRAEFAAMITRALSIPDSALAGYTTTTFKDTSGYGWAVPYLAFCQSKGIMLGDGQGNVMPGRTITVNEAMTMALRAIGYTANSSLLVGVWPSNYVSIAQNEDLYDKVAASTTVDKASAAQIIYNLLTVQKVAVNTDGTTDSLWKDKKSEVEANLLNTNLGCTEHEDIILGANYGYDDAIINITGKIGAHGTAYLNKDDELVAFKAKDSTALTGKIDAGKFKVGDTKYDLPGTATISAVFANTVSKGSTTGAIDTLITNIASAYNDGKTLTINADVSGKKIKEVYSVVAWHATDADLAPSSVQSDISDKELLSNDFDQDDDKNIDVKSFQLVGVASLDKIAEDNVVYVYSDGDYIRKVAVGTTIVEGTLDEINDTDEVLTIGGKDYDVANVNIPGVKKVGDYSIDSEGKFYLDASGKVYDFDGTSGLADTYGVVIGTDINTVNETLNNAKVKLYLSDDSEKTFTLAKKASKIDWVPSTSSSSVLAPLVTPGALVGYSLDSNGDIKTLDASAKTSASVDFQSTKVLKLNGASKSIDSNAVVFTYDGTRTNSDDYDIAKLSEVVKGSIATSGKQASVILNKDDKVVALFIDVDYVDVAEDSVYGVINARSNAKDGDDSIFKFTGLIDGKVFTGKKSADNTSSNYAAAPGAFGVYKIKVDANDVIKTITQLTAEGASTGSALKLKTANDDGQSGLILAASVITEINSDRDVVTVGTNKYTIGDDAVVYKYDPNGGSTKFTAAKLSNLKKNYTVALYDTKGDDADGVASVVIYIED